MIGRAFAAMVILALAGQMASAGILQGGTWVPTGCGTEPPPPKINSLNPAAYEASIKLVQAYEKTMKDYNACVFKEAETDNHTISAALRDQQQSIQATFDKLTADSKAAVDKLNGKKP